MAVRRRAAQAPPPPAPRLARRAPPEATDRAGPSPGPELKLCPCRPAYGAPGNEHSSAYGYPRQHTSAHNPQSRRKRDGSERLPRDLDPTVAVASQTTACGLSNTFRNAVPSMTMRRFR